MGLKVPNGAGVQTPVSRMAGYFGGIAVEPPRPIGDFTRYSPHRGTVSWHAVSEHDGWLRRMHPITEE